MAELTMSTDDGRRRRSTLSRRQTMLAYCARNFKTFLEQSTLHGLKFVADSSLTVWERLFFLVAFVATVIATANLIANIYTKWENTPVIIGSSPHATSIMSVPFPAITLCNMNQVLRSKVANFTRNSFDHAILKILCLSETVTDEQLYEAPNFRNNNITISDFIIEKAQPCSQMLLSCEFSSWAYNCSDMFQEVITDEGLCCAFNTLHPSYLYFGDRVTSNREFTRNDGRIPVDWNPETGYQADLPRRYSPRTATGTGVSMGLTIVLNAQMNEYFCSSTNGPGFKVSLHNPIETTNVKETGITVPLGHETRFRIDAISSEAAPTIRTVNKAARQCLFINEEPLLFYKYYTRRNCLVECEAIYSYETCQCIPYKLPKVFPNATICTAKESYCISKAERDWIDVTESDQTCRKRCLPNCFDLAYLPNTFTVPLAEQNYTIPNELLKNMNKEYVSKNIAIIHFYYRESVFYGNLKNVYIGLTEFLSNTGGILGLFMGFSFISLTEILYFAILLPIFDFLLPQHTLRFRKASSKSTGSTAPITDQIQVRDKNWLSGELHVGRRNPRIQSTSKILKRYKNNHIIGAITTSDSNKTTAWIKDTT